MVDETKICFIICSNNEMYLEECFFYINQLEVPEGYALDAISIFEAESMAKGYNEAMNASDAKYKIYLHQDVFILYKGFLQAILDIFQADATIGMIGMVGAPKMPIGGVMWQGHREGQLYGVNNIVGDYKTYQYSLQDGLHEVDAIDGLMMITCVDIPWREDKFDGWDFYDVSQSFEVRKKGYKVVVPEQLCPWCKHDGGVLNLIRYDKYRKICMAEYPEYFEPERFKLGKFHSVHDGKLRIMLVARNQLGAVKSTIESVKAFSDLDESRFVVVDNGSEDGLKHLLLGQDKMEYVICGEMGESYEAILNKVILEFVGEEDLLVLTPELMVVPGCIDALREALAEWDCGAVCAKEILSTSAEGKQFSDAAQYAMAQADQKGGRMMSELPGEAILFGNEMLKHFAQYGSWDGYCCYEVQNAFVYKRIRKTD